MIDASNIVAFPRERRPGTPPQTFEEVHNRVQGLKMRRIDDATEALMMMLFDGMALAGFNFQVDGGYDKDIALVVEGLRSLLCAHDGICHRLQDVARKVIDRSPESNVRLRGVG
jgi:hypothetical protein